MPLAYGIKKLQISCVVEDDKVNNILHHLESRGLKVFFSRSPAVQIGTDFLEEKIGAFEDHVQSVDIAAFNKV